MAGIIFCSFFTVYWVTDSFEQRVKAIKLAIEVARCRRLARVRPYGLDGTLDVSELLLPLTAESLLSNEHLEHYELALAAFLEGNWGSAYELLHSIPPQDLGKDLLISYILKHNHQPPAGWNGVIPMESKN